MVADRGGEAGRRSPPRRGAVVAASMLAAVAICVLGWAPAAFAGGDDPLPSGDGRAPSVVDVLQGHVPSVSAHASGGFAMDQPTTPADSNRFKVSVDVVNRSANPISLTMPVGALFASDDSTEQTGVVSGTAVSSPNAPTTGNATSFIAAPGTSHHEFDAFCAQHADFGPDGTASLHYVGRSLPTLQTVLSTINADHPDYDTAQRAVWWVTDTPTYPATVPGVAKLLRNIDAKGFAAHPTQVVPDAHYRPEWKGGGPAADASPVFGPIAGPQAEGPTLVDFAVGILVALVVIGVIVGISMRKPTRAPVRATTRSVLQPAGWYPDPGAPGWQRWWDGNSWTAARRPLS